MGKAYAVLSAIGADRVGIVDDLAALVAGRGGNIEESKMAVLGGEFAVMMLFAMEDSALGELAEAREGIESRLSLRIGIKRTSKGDPEDPSRTGLAQGRPYTLETVSLDGKGIVHAVSAVLRSYGINIEDLETRTERAPLTGAPLFRMKADIVLGPEVVASSLRRELEELQAGQDLDVALQPLVPTRRD
jgi:glycine cleavage system transcriptional repressor